MRKWRIRTVAALMLVAALVPTVWAAMPEVLVPGGNTVGIRLEAAGLLVVGFDKEGNSAAQEAGMKKGDIIKTVDGKEIADCESFKKLVADNTGEILRLGIMRGDVSHTLEILPQKDASCYRLGIFVRDSMAGIGTVTFYDPESGCYGALGHGVNDAESMVLIPLERGDILPSSVVEVKRGQSGAPGALKGSFDTAKIIGSVLQNTEHGIFGESELEIDGNEAIPVAKQSEIHSGSAVILANVDGTEVCEYKVEISKLFPGEHESGRNILLTVKDETLLKKTGGIVQGMSGSPILQDGKIVGAVTHVLVNNPEQGYGIFIENMLAASDAPSLFDNAA